MKRTALLLLAGAALLQAGCNRGDARIVEAEGKLGGRPAAALPPMAPPPGWAAGLAGRPFAETFPDATARCDGAVDGVIGQVQGGVIQAGWAWNPAAKAVVERVVLVDSAGRMVGFAEGHSERRDVPRHRPDIPAIDTGWTAHLPTPKEPLTAYGLLEDGRACRIGVTPQP